ncbi:MAG TPA: rhomboid family intramembrane serine protease [Calidithermus sp.]|nr:rhomboid family intramembrane serine protease [Calidithermus sp.]
MSEAADTPVRITPDMLLWRRVDFERRMRRVPPLTTGLAAALVGVFGLEVAAGALDSPPALIAAGALSRPAVLAGEYWRLLAATFLHGGLEHLASNVVALYVLGMVGEHAFGWRQFAVLYAASALGGSLASLALSTAPSVGASGALFGLQAAAIVLFRRHRDRLLVRDRRIGVVLAVWAVLSVAGGLVSPYIDNAAHLGGFLAGWLVGGRLHPVVLEPMAAARRRQVDRALAVVGAVLVYTLGGWLL